MTRDEAKQLLPIIQAFAEGKVIEVYDCFRAKWVTQERYDFDNIPEYYRIKIEPKTVPLSQEDMVPGIQFRSLDGTIGSLTWADEHYIATPFRDTMSYHQLLNEKFEYRTPDNLTWRPCSKTVEE